LLVGDFQQQFQGGDKSSSPSYKEALYGLRNGTSH